ncbi:MAG: hypothetical protein ABI707_08305 [Ferruginibacter sp.]
MKNELETSPLLFKMILLVTGFMLVMVCSKSMAAALPTASGASARVAVNFKNDIVKNELRIRVISGTEAVLQLFIFTPDGILIREVAVSAHRKTTIRCLKKGFYLYECFHKDERVKSGSLIIK